MKCLLTSLMFLFSLNPLLHAQSDSTYYYKKIEVSGYLKHLATVTFNKNFDEYYSDNLIHYRLNLKWEPSPSLSLAAETRNRFFWGESIKQYPDYVSLLQNDNERWNLHKTWLYKSRMLVHSNVERLYADLNFKKWNLRFGRQRINWAMAAMWNPNDLFNAYDFLDFDYEERPGVDGIKIHRVLNGVSHLEGVLTGSRNKRNITAFRYYVNMKQFDMQATLGWYDKRPVIGAGWSGHLGDAGYRGELQYFYKRNNMPAHHNIYAEFDYMFKNNWYTLGGVFYNSKGTVQNFSNESETNYNVTSEELIPTRWNFIFHVVKDISPLINENCSIIYAPGTKLLIIENSLTYNLCSSVDADTVWQSYFASINTNFQATGHFVFLRVRWSY